MSFVEGSVSEAGPKRPSTYELVAMRRTQESTQARRGDPLVRGDCTNHDFYGFWLAVV